MYEITENDRVLFVDDEELMLQSIQRGLKDEKYMRYYANNAASALAIMEKIEISVLVSDIKMPRMSGLELLQIVREQYPDVVRIVLTAYSQISTILAAINQGSIHRYLTKPWKLDEEFIPTIRQAIEYHNMVLEKKMLADKLSVQNEELKTKQKEVEDLMKLTRESDENKTKIINTLTKNIMPYISDVVQATDDTSPSSLYQVSRTLNIKGREILILLRNVQRLLGG